MSILNEIQEQLQKGKAKVVTAKVEEALSSGVAPQEIMQVLLDAMGDIGERFKRDEVFVPDVMIAARAMNRGLAALKPHLLDGGVKPIGRACIGTVKGDLHDIGKNLVKMMLEGRGFEVIDLGVDVAPETFVRTAVEQDCSVICCSALLTTTMSVMGDVVKAAEAAGIRENVKIMIGGAPVTESFCNQIGADAFTPDATSAAEKAVSFCA